MTPQQAAWLRTPACDTLYNALKKACQIYWGRANSLVWRGQRDMYERSKIIYMSRRSASKFRSTNLGESTFRFEKCGGVRSDDAM